MIDYRGLNIPKVSFGAVSSDDLFGPLDQGVFDFYEANANRYRRALDIGANIGVHSILMARQGWQVMAFEPDPIHYGKITENIDLNIGESDWDMQILRGAVSNHKGKETFVRVNGNTTGSHLKGDKKPYGDLEEFTVEVLDCRPLFAWADFAKVDCEGHEAKLLRTVKPGSKCEFMVEVTDKKTAKAIFDHFHGWRKMWAQRHEWGEVTTPFGMPMHHSDGHLFIGNAPPFP